MHYALYRKYRPTTFDDVIGQEHVTDTLRNQIINGRPAHSYIFTGTRGTGKTTCAKILAKALNCENPVNGNPCGVCSTCKGIAEGSIFSVIEMDAASNNGVDDVRGIIDEVIYPPIDAKFKVYIIDEVHMLSTSAFNALLKTIEEPPEHAIFIFATTEIQKVPATIKSRCVRFDMSRLSKKQLSDYVKVIASKENKKISDSIADTVAILGDGSVRDTLSVLEKVIDVEDEKKVNEILGICDKKELFDISSAIASGDIAGLLSIMADFYGSSKEYGLLTSDLSEFYRKLLVARITRDPAPLLELSGDDVREYVAEAAKYKPAHIIAILNKLREHSSLLRVSINKRADTEICLIGCMQEPKLPDAAIPDIPVPTMATAAKQIPAKEQPAPTEEKKNEPPKREEPKKEEPAKQPEEKKENPVPQKIPEKPIQNISDDKYRRFDGFADAIKELKRVDMFLALNIQANAIALIKPGVVLLVFTNKEDKKDAVESGMDTKVRAALDNMHMKDFRFLTTVGNLSDFLEDTRTTEDYGDSLFSD